MGFMSNPASGGDFDPYLKMNAKAGRFYTKNASGDEFEVVNLTAVFDMDNLKTGWFLFASGQAPQKTLDPSLTESTPKPSDLHKRGFELRVYSEKNLGGVREFASTAGIVIEAMNALYDAWMADKGKNPGKLPVVKCVDVHPITNKHGTNYQPQFEITGWADRPEALGGGAAAKAPPPAAKTPEPAPAMAGDDDDVDF